MRVRRSDRKPPVTPIRDTALFRGALIEIANQAVEIERLRRLLAEHGVEGGESRLDRLHELRRGELD